MSIMWWKDKNIKDDNLDSFLKEYDLDLLGELPMSAEVIDITNNGIKSLTLTHTSKNSTNQPIEYKSALFI